MPVEWIILIGVLLVAVFAGCLIVLRYDGREKPGGLKPSEESERRIAAAKERDDAADARPERKRPDIPVWRDKPTGKSP